MTFEGKNGFWLLMVVKKAIIHLAFCDKMLRRV
jgi:hypothetical protein